MTGASVRRLLSRGCFVAAGAAVMVALLPVGAGAQTAGAHPKIFSTTTSAVGVDFYPDQQGGITPIAETFHVQFVAGQSSMSSSNGPSARSSVINPGNGLTQGPAQACPLLVSSLAENGFPGADQLQPIVDACTGAKWPFMTQADGFTPDNSTDVGLNFGDPQGQFDGRDGSGRATLNKDGTSSTDATMGGVHVAALPGAGPTGLPVPSALPTLPGQSPGTTNVSLFNSGSIQATTQNFFDGSTTVSHAESRLSGVSIFGGLITIDSITSIAETRFGVGSNPVGASSTTVQGVKFLGQDATIDDTGVHPVNGALTDPMNAVLSGLGLSVKLVGATQGFDDKGFMTAQSQGVAIDFLHPLQTGVNLPPPPPPFNEFIATSPTINGEYFVHYNIAAVDSRAFARDLTIGSGSTGSSSTPTPFASSPVTGGGQASGFTGGTVSAPAPPPTVPSASAPLASTGFLGLYSGKIKFLYLAFTLATLGMCLVPRLALPARLPGPAKA